MEITPIIDTSAGDYQMNSLLTRTLKKPSKAQMTCVLIYLTVVDRRFCVTSIDTILALQQQGMKPDINSNNKRHKGMLMMYETTKCP